LCPFRARSSAVGEPAQRAPTMIASYWFSAISPSCLGGRWMDGSCQYVGYRRARTTASLTRTKQRRTRAWYERTTHRLDQIVLEGEGGRGSA
jgi:hypothetical protein